MDGRIVVTLVCMAGALVCVLSLLALAVEARSRYAPLSVIAAIYGVLCAWMPAGAYIYHLLRAAP